MYRDFLLTFALEALHRGLVSAELQMGVMRAWLSRTTVGREEVSNETRGSAMLIRAFCTGRACTWRRQWSESERRTTSSLRQSRRVTTRTQYGNRIRLIRLGNIV